MAGDKVGYRVVGTVKSVKGTCSWGHKEGDTFEVSAHDTAGLCGFLYHDAFPWITMLQFGGSFPPAWGDTEVVEVACVDLTNLLRLELRRVR